MPSNTVSSSSSDSDVSVGSKRTYQQESNIDDECEDSNQTPTEKRRIANRKASVACRLRKKIFINELQRRVLELTQKNSKYEAENEMLRDALKVKMQAQAQQAQAETMQQLWMQQQALTRVSVPLVAPTRKSQQSMRFSNNVNANTDVSFPLDHQIPVLPMSSSSSMMVRQISPTSSFGSHLINRSGKDYAAASLASSFNSNIISSSSASANLDVSSAYEGLIDHAIQTYVSRRNMGACAGQSAEFL